MLHDLQLSQLATSGEASQHAGFLLFFSQNDKPLAPQELPGLIEIGVLPMYMEILGGCKMSL